MQVLLKLYRNGVKYIAFLPVDKLERTFSAGLEIEEKKQLRRPRMHIGILKPVIVIKLVTSFAYT